MLEPRLRYARCTTPNQTFDPRSITTPTARAPRTAPGLESLRRSHGTPNSSRIRAAQRSASVSTSWKLDPSTNAISRHVDLVNVAEILGLDIDGDDAWLAVRHPGQVGAVLRIDIATGAVVEEHAVSLPAAVKLDAEHAWVASYLTNELLGFPR